MKRAFSILLAFVMLLSLSITAFATETEGVITSATSVEAEAWKAYTGTPISVPDDYGELTEGSFFIAKFTQAEMAAAPTLGTGFSVKIATGSSANIKGYIGQYASGSTKGSVNKWLPVFKNGTTQTNYEAPISSSDAWTGTSNFAPVNFANSASYFAVGFSLKSAITDDVAVTISLLDNKGSEIASRTYTFLASANASCDPVSKIVVNGFGPESFTTYENTFDNDGNQAFCLKAVITGGNGSEAPTWTTSNENVASLETVAAAKNRGVNISSKLGSTNAKDTDAYVTIKGVGTATITAAIGDISGTYVITIDKAYAAAIGDTTYDTLTDALNAVSEDTSISVSKSTNIGSVVIEYGSTISVAESQTSGGASAKKLTITKSDNTTETAYLVTVGATTSAVKSGNIDNEVVAKDSSGNTLSGNAAAAQLFDIPKVLANISATANAAVADVDFAMKATDEGVDQKEGHTKTFEVHPFATDGTTEYEVPADALTAQEYSVTLDLGVANAGMYARLTHYKSGGGTEALGTYQIGTDGKVNFTMDSFSPVGADVIYAEDDATFTLTVDAPESIDVDTEFEVEVKLTSTVDTNLNTIKFSYTLPDKFTEVAGSKTGCLAAASEQTDGNWIWNAGGGANIALTANTPASLGTFKAKVAQADAEYNADKTFKFNSATLTFSGVPYKEYTANAASDTTNVKTTYAITWDYNGGKVGSDTSSTDNNVGVNVVPTAPTPVKPGYNLSWNPTVVKATADVTYTAVWTLNTSGMDVKFNDYGYAYLNGTDFDKLLVLKAPTPDDGYAYAIDGSLMYATTNANYRGLVSAAENETVYVYIVSGDETKTTILGDSTVGGATKLSVVEGTNEVLAYNGDLNRDGSAKQGDLGVLVDLFNDRALYGRTGVVDIRARLEADIDNSANAENSFKSIADINAIIGKLFPASGG